MHTSSTTIVLQTQEFVDESTCSLAGEGMEIDRIIASCWLWTTKLHLTADECSLHTVQIREQILSDHMNVMGGVPHGGVPIN